MTLPYERTHSIKMTRDFLRSLLDPKQTPRIPRKIRDQAYYCLRHFPADWDIEQVAKKSKNVFGRVPKKDYE